jgi:ssDNA-binding Zn-finger/Zn-ribbon topoisomerase 1
MINPDIQLSKACPECGRELKIRENRENGNQFLGCSGWPQCKHTEAIPETLKMQLAGAPTLFDVPTEPRPAVDDRPVFRCTRRSRKS